MTTAPLHEQIELHRDRIWHRDEDLRVESAIDAERFIEEVGSANTLTDVRRAGPSLYIAVCGRGYVSLPRSISEKEPEARRDAPHLVPQGRSHAPRSRLLRETRGGRSMFVAPALISHFAGGLHLQIPANYFAIRKASAFSWLRID